MALETVAQKNDNMRKCTNEEWMRAVLQGTCVKVTSNPDAWGYLYKGELYVREEIS